MSATMTPEQPYPRDLVGYGGQPPHPRWPGDAKIAVSIVLNVEEGGESCVLHGDRFSESVLTDVGARPLQDTRNMNVESTFEYGSRVGFWEILRILRERHVVVAMICKELVWPGNGIPKRPRHSR